MDERDYIAMNKDAQQNGVLVGGSLLIRSLNLLEEMIDNHNADAVLMSEEHYKEVKRLIKDIRELKHKK